MGPTDALRGRLEFDAVWMTAGPAGCLRPTEVAQSTQYLTGSASEPDRTGTSQVAAFQMVDSRRPG